MISSDPIRLKRFVVLVLGLFRVWFFMAFLRSGGFELQPQCPSLDLPQPEEELPKDAISPNENPAVIRRISGLPSLFNSNFNLSGRPEKKTPGFV
jgi:hypothetical protein